MIIDREQLGQTICGLRKAAGLTQQQLADHLGVSNVTISQYEGAKSMPSLTAIAEVAQALNTTVGTLLGEGQPTDLLVRVTSLQRHITKKLAELAALTEQLAQHSGQLADALDGMARP
jgi:transcriptional regulator with XRE-family HTH domain